MSAGAFLNWKSFDGQVINIKLDIHWINMMGLAPRRIQWSTQRDLKSTMSAISQGVMRPNDASQHARGQKDA